MPKFARIDLQQNWLYDTKTQKITNFLSVFATVEDIDPHRDFPRLTLHMLGHDLFWEIPVTKDDAYRKSCTYSAGFLSSFDNLPGATYELRMHTQRNVIRSEKITIPQSSAPSVSDFPLLHNQRLSAAAVLFVYHQQDFFLATYLDPSYVLPKREQGESFYLYTFSDAMQAGLVCGPY